jgi:hypothetical protein
VLCCSRSRGHVHTSGLEVLIVGFLLRPVVDRIDFAYLTKFWLALADDTFQVWLSRHAPSLMAMMV